MNEEPKHGLHVGVSYTEAETKGRVKTSIAGEENGKMARYQLTRAIYVDPPGPGRLRAGTWISTTPAEMQPGDVFWPTAPTNLPTGAVSTITGGDSVSG